MHISEGVVSFPVLAAGGVLTLAGVAIGLRKMQYDKLPEVAVLSSVFFVGSLIHIPIGPSAAHLVLNGVCGLLLGWLAFPAILVGSTLQAILFQFGGLTTLGVNTFNMAFPAVLFGCICGRFIRSSKRRVRMVAEFVAGGGSVLLSGLLVAVSMVATGDSFVPTARLIVLVHIPVMIVEGIITIIVIEFIKMTRPQMLRSHPMREDFQGV